MSHEHEKLLIPFFMLNSISGVTFFADQTLTFKLVNKYNVELVITPKLILIVIQYSSAFYLAYKYRQIEVLVAQLMKRWMKRRTSKSLIHSIGYIEKTKPLPCLNGKVLNPYWSSYTL